ncbi:HAMP domain-containing histidine kinase, partial [Patescibacteria group bacterium]|nr:HAMP domain-containing histidine kinase [Patescibacteria group bacterium]
DYFYKIANRYFFTSLYDSREVIAELSDKLRTSLQINQIYTFVHDILSNSFHTKVFEFWKYNQKTGKYSILYSNGINFGEHKKVQSNKYLHEKFIQNNQPIVTEEIRNAEYNQNTKEFIDLLSSLKIAVLVPLNAKDKLIGLLALGQKETGDMYNDEDFMVLRVAGSQVAVAIENALLYEETQNFNIKLKKEIHTATQDLLVANQRLMWLDQAKSEFISIASHQLRTPLTVIKGYLSMILEGDFGKVEPKQQDPLNKVYLSGEQMIQLVNDFLSISRIEADRLEFNYEMTNLENMVNNIVDDLKKTIKQKNLSLKYIKSSEQLPLVKIDQEKMRQTIINVIDNAIKYTRQGNITVSLKMVDGKIQFCVSDSGAGISQDDLPMLFKKFSRGKTISKMYTEGTGLGLYVARKMVEAHKGKMWAESEGENKGSQIYFQLPVD